MATGSSLPPAFGFRPLLGEIFLLTGIFYVNFLGRTILAPLLPAMERELGFGPAQGGSLFLLVSGGYSLTLLLSGFAACRLGHRRTILLCNLSLALSLFLVALCRDLWGLRLGMFLVGATSGFYLPSGMATLTSLAPPRYWGRVVAIHELGPNLGFLTAPLWGEGLLALGSWRLAFLAVGAVGLLLGLVHLWLGRGGSFPGQAPSPAALRALLASPAVWVVTPLLMAGVGASLGLFAVLPLFLVHAHGFVRTDANLLVAGSRVLGAGMSLLAGFLSDRLGPRQTLAISLAGCGLLTLGLGLAPTGQVEILVFLQPLLAVLFFPPLFTALARTSSPEGRNLAVSLAAGTGILVGGGALPAIMGIMGELGYFRLGIALFGGLLLAGLLLLPRLKLEACARSQA